MYLFTMVDFLFLFALTSGVGSLELISTPKYLQRSDQREINFTCKTSAQEPIASCQFRIWYSGVQQEGELMRITNNRDIVSMKNPLADDGSNFTFTPFSTSFQYGQCGVTLNNVAGGQLLVGCKLTTKSNVAVVKTIPLYKTGSLELKLLDNSEEIHVKLGEDVSFTSKSKTDKINLAKCTIKANGTNQVVTARFTAKNPTRYQPWINKGECGFKIPHVTESDEHTFFLLAEGGTSIGAKAVTIVLEGNLKMVLDKKVEDYQVGDQLTATCTTRVVPQQDHVWTWKLGKDVIGNDKAIEVSNEVWGWPWQTMVISDTRSFKLAKEYRYKELSCTLGTLNGDKSNDRTSSVKLNFKVPKATTAPAPKTPTGSPDKSEDGRSAEPSSSSADTNGDDAKNDKDKSATANENTSKTTGELQSWQLSSPEYATISSYDTTTVLCKADFALTGCGFSIDAKYEENFFNASLGSVTREKAKLGPFSVKYHGLGLDKGECGIELTTLGQYDQSLLLGCRARTEHSGWKYNYTFIEDDASHPSRVKFQTVPRFPFLLPGSNLTVKCDLNSGNNANKCNITLPGQESFGIDEKYEPSSPHNYKYVGDGLDKGHCGIFIPDVDTLDTSNGNTIMCETETSVNGRLLYPRRVFRIVVAGQPIGGPTLSVTPTYTSNPTVTLKCVTPASRPPASIAWYLGDDPVAADRISEEPVGKWRWWRDMETTTQYITLNATDNPDGKNITCVSSYLGVVDTRNSSIAFQHVAPEGDPKISVTPTDYTLNSSITLKCVTPASRPPASIAWYLGDKPLPADRISEEPVGKWRWWRDMETTTQTITLNLTEDDEGKNVTCVMSHVALPGKRHSTLTISAKRETTTNPTATEPSVPISYSQETGRGFPTETQATQPPGSPGSTTAIIVGAVVAVLLLISIVIGIAFAYTKKLAFFKEHSPEEDSLNPSTVVGAQTAPQKVRQHTVPTQPVQPLRQRRPTPPDTHELLPVRSDVADEKVEYAEIVRSPGAPPVAAVKPTVVPPEEEVEYTELSWGKS